MKKVNLLLSALALCFVGFVSCEKAELNEISNPKVNSFESTDQNENPQALEQQQGWGRNYTLYFGPPVLGSEPHCDPPATNCYDEIVVRPLRSISDLGDGISSGGILNNPNAFLDLLADSILQYTDDNLTLELINSAQQGAYIPVARLSLLEPGKVFLMLTEDGSQNTAYRTFQIKVNEPILGNILPID